MSPMDRNRYRKPHDGDVKMGAEPKWLGSFRLKIQFRVARSTILRIIQRRCSDVMGGSMGSIETLKFFLRIIYGEVVVGFFENFKAIKRRQSRISTKVLCRV